MPEAPENTRQTDELVRLASELDEARAELMRLTTELDEARVETTAAADEAARLTSEGVNLAVALAWALGRLEGLDQSGTEAAHDALEAWRSRRTLIEAEEP